MDGPAPQTTRRSSQNGPLLFLVAFSRLPLCRHGRATGFLLGAYGPCRRLRDGYRISICRLRLFCLSCPISSSTLSFLRHFVRHFVRITAAIQGRRSLQDGLRARAKANNYQKGAHRDNDGLRDHNKHMDKIKKDQNTALDRYIL
jgi:hypothetical protein